MSSRTLSDRDDEKSLNATSATKHICDLGPPNDVETRVHGDTHAVTKFIVGSVVSTPRGFQTRDADSDHVTVDNIKYLANGVLYMTRERFDTSDVGEFFWTSTDLMSILDSDGTWKVVNSACPTPWVGPSRIFRAAHSLT